MTKDAEIIEAMGGTNAVARLCEISTASVAAWKREGNAIPKPWRKYFQEIRPDLFGTKRKKRFS